MGCLGRGGEGIIMVGNWPRGSGELMTWTVRGDKNVLVWRIRGGRCIHDAQGEGWKERWRRMGRDLRANG